MKTASEIPVIRIEPSSGWVSLKLRELWEYRELLYFLAWRDIKVRYKQTALGMSWAIIQPFFTMIVFSIFFGSIGSDSVRRNSVPYLQLCSFSTVDFFCQWTHSILKQSGHRRSID